MKKIIIPFAYYYPEQCAGIYIIDDIARACARNGIEVELIVPTPTRNVLPIAIWKRDEWQEGGRIHIHRIRMYREGKSPLIRALRYALIEIAFLHSLLWKRYDAIFMDSTPPIQGLKLPIVRMFRKKPVIHNVQDIFPDSLVGAGLATKDGLLWKIGSIISEISYHFSNKIIVISDDFKKNLMQKGVPKEKIEVVYNWVDEKKVVPVDKEKNPLYNEFGLDRSKFRIVYAGNLGNAQNIGVIIDTAALLKNRTDIEFVIFGSGGSEKTIKQKICNLQLNNVRMFPLQSKEKISCVYSLGDLCIVSCKAGFGGSAMPSKTWSILSTATPILASFDDGELRHIIEYNDLGFFTLPDDSQAMADVIMQAKNNPVKLKEMGLRGRRFIEENLTKDKNTQKYVDIIKSLEINKNKV